MFLALAITCDEYFVTSLEKICEVLGSWRSSFRVTRCVCTANHKSFSLISAEIGSEWRRRGSHLHGSWQFCTRAFCICHRYSHTHRLRLYMHPLQRSQMVGVTALSLLGFSPSLPVRRCLHHPRWRGGGNHRGLGGLQHPLHYRRVRDLRWTGMCVCFMPPCGLLCGCLSSERRFLLPQRHPVYL